MRFGGRMSRKAGLCGRPSVPFAGRCFCLLTCSAAWGNRTCGGDENAVSQKKRFITESWGKSSLGARLRTRKVTGRDASLPAPLMSAFEMLVARETVGALPQTPQGTLSLDPARGRRKGTKSPLDPSARLSWSRFHAPSACSFLLLRLSPCLLPQLSVKNQKRKSRSRHDAGFCFFYARNVFGKSACVIAFLRAAQVWLTAKNAGNS